MLKEEMKSEKAFKDALKEVIEQTTTFRTINK